MELRWEENDRLHLVFVDGETVRKETVTVVDISPNGKSARFDIPIPEGITSDVFDIHGIHGNVTFSDTPGEEHLATLSSSWTRGSLAEIMADDLVLLSFKIEDFDKTSTEPATANFSHVGSLFNIHLKNSGDTDLAGVTGVELTAASPIWAHQADGTPAYNVVAGTFSGTTTTGTSLPFTIDVTDLLAGRTIELWGWYPPVQGGNEVAWPAINLKVNAGSAYETTEPKATRAEATGLGKVFYLFGEYNEGDMAYYTPVTDIDGNVYKTVVIKDKDGVKREWLAENLRVTKFNDGTEIPHVIDNAAWAALTTPGYSYYNNDPVHGHTYGAPYNWYAVETGKLCPEGWRVPSRNEFIKYLREPLGGAAVAGGVLKSTGTIEARTGLWESPNEGATNKTGFTAVPNGKRHADAGSFQYLGMLGNFWTTTLDDKKNAARITVNSTTTNFSSGWKDTRYGYAVRCVKGY